VLGTTLLTKALLGEWVDKVNPDVWLVAGIEDVTSALS